eukprot:COSAG02_NODE_27594_length_606_cov_1.043393_2_plen_73_part_01
MLAKLQRCQAKAKTRGQVVARRDKKVVDLQAEITNLEAEIAGLKVKQRQIGQELQGVDDERAQLQDRLEAYVS